jgi:hypothetical protein
MEKKSREMWNFRQKIAVYFYKRRYLWYNEKNKYREARMISTFLRIRHRANIDLPRPISLAILLGFTIYNLLPVFRYFRYRLTVTGTIAELTEDRENRHRNLITAAYSIDGSTYYVRSFYSHSIPYYKTGIEIPVRVSEKNPAHAMLPHDLRTAVLASVITGAAFVFVLIVSLR